MLVLKCDLDVFQTIILENILHFNSNILLLDFSFNIFFFLIKYLVITSPEYDGSFCFEIKRENRFHPTACTVYSFEMHVAEKRAS